jgi:hypothetical protein
MPIVDVRDFRPNVKTSHTNPNPVIPTGDRRHITHVREGVISFELFNRRRREKIPVDWDVEVDNAKGEVKGAAEMVLRGRTERAIKERNRPPSRPKRKSVQKAADKGKKKGKVKAQASSKKVTKPQKPKVKKYVKRNKD